MEISPAMPPDTDLLSQLDASYVNNIPYHLSMGAEVFDDVAFYYVSTSFIACCVIPTTLYIIWSELSRLLFGNKEKSQSSSISSPSSKPTSDNETSSKSGNQVLADHTNVVVDPKKFIEEQLRSKKIITTETFTQRYFKKRYLLLIIGWIIFIYLLSLNSSMKGKNFVQFDPYEILDIDYGASDNDIRKAFRRQSMKWHPDKHTTNKEDAETRFMAINKAYQALTDPTTKANFERYGNPDGNQGHSVTYGLPTWLSSKNNEVLVLIIYFIVFVTIPPALGYYYFRSNSDFHESGVMNSTIGWYASALHENLTAKYLLEPLCIAMEFRGKFTEQNEQQIEAIKALYEKVRKFSVPMKYQNIYYVLMSCISIQAYMQRVFDAEVLKDNLVYILEKLPLLTSTMIGISAQKRLLKPILGTLDVIQCVIQGIWLDHPSPLLQLPHITSAHVDKLTRKSITTINQFRSTKREEIIKILGVSEQDYEEMAAVSKVIPNVEVNMNAYVPGYEDVHLGDILTIDVHLKRRQDIFIQDTTPLVVGSTQAQIAAKKKLTQEERDAKKAELHRKIDNWEITTEQQHSSRGEAPLVVSNTFPHPKKEVWYIILTIFEAGQERILDMKTLKSFDQETQVKFLLQVNPTTKGKYNYEVKVRCDSYVGCDVTKPVHVNVLSPNDPKLVEVVDSTDQKSTKGGKKGGKSKKQASKQKKKGEKQSVDSILEELDDLDKENDDDDDDGETTTTTNGPLRDDENDEEDDDEDLDFSDDLDTDQQGDVPGKWYYLGGSSFVEFLFNLALFSFIITLAYNELSKRGLWQTYIDPVLHRVWAVIGPYLIQLHQQTEFITSPILSALNNALMWFLGETTDMPIEIKLEKAMKSRGRMF